VLIQLLCIAHLEAAFITQSHTQGGQVLGTLSVPAGACDHALFIKGEDIFKKSAYFQNTSSLSLSTAKSHTGSRSQTENGISAPTYLTLNKYAAEARLIVRPVRAVYERAASTYIIARAPPSGLTRAEKTPNC
jgi:hypothetical protein